MKILYWVHERKYRYKFIIKLKGSKGIRINRNLRINHVTHKKFVCNVPKEIILISMELESFVSLSAPNDIIHQACAMEFLHYDTIV